ncbi:caspase b-like [Odontesthes bonariensis]|uniref:caspase b-like n=1 Tax=Odontesthes bonariensis TaxID=219752 RepID=UPI003F5807EE
MVPQMLLIETLEGIYENDFKKFKYYLTLEVLDSCRPIPKGRLETASRTETVDLMTQAYGEEMAVTITVEILRKLLINDAADKLKRKYAAGLKPESSSSTAAHPPPTPPSSTTSVSAQDGAVVFAPMITSSSPGTWNITINK